MSKQWLLAPDVATLTSRWSLMPTWNAEASNDFTTLAAAKFVPKARRPRLKSDTASIVQESWKRKKIHMQIVEWMIRNSGKRQQSNHAKNLWYEAQFDGEMLPMIIRRNIRISVFATLGVALDVAPLSHTEPVQWCANGQAGSGCWWALLVSTFVVASRRRWWLITNDVSPSALRVVWYEQPVPRQPPDADTRAETA
jgi:hypothetical protein